MLRAFSILLLATSVVLAAETEPASPDPRAEHRKVEAAKAAWLSTCATSVVLCAFPTWRRSVNQWLVGRQLAALTELDDKALAATAEVDRLLADAPPPLPGISARLGVERFYQALYPTAFNDGSRHWDEEETRYSKWLSVARHPNSQQWTRHFVDALAVAAPLRRHRLYRRLPETLREKLDACARLQQAMPPGDWIDVALADPTASFSFRAGE